MSLHPKVIDLTLDRVQRLLAALDNPQDRLPPVIHLAGTNGKGSTQAMIRAGLEASGEICHAYTSPHLAKFHERIVLSGKIIDENILAEYLSKCEEVNGNTSITYFEITTCAALLAFSQIEADYTLLEVGLGGRLDVVNIIDPDMAVITNIGIDHIDWLGDNVEDIGREKAGILRNGIPLIYGATEMPASVQQSIDTQQATCYQIGQDFSYRDIDATTWQYSNAAVTLQLPRPALSLTNTANALSAVLASPLDVGIKAIEQALQTVKLAGRFDYRENHSRHWLFDVAHNEQGVEFLLAQLSPFWQQHVAKQSNQDSSADIPTPKIKMLFSMLGDKDIDKVVQRLTQAGLPVSDWFVAEIDYPRAATTEQLQDVLAKYIDSTNIYEFDGLHTATHAVIEASQPQDLIVVCGSFHTIGEALSALSV